MRKKVNNYGFFVLLDLYESEEVAYWISEKGYCYSCLLGYGTKPKRISANSYQNAYEEYHNY